MSCNEECKGGLNRIRNKYTKKRMRKENFAQDVCSFSDVMKRCQMSPFILDMGYICHMIVIQLNVTLFINYPCLE